MNKGEKGEQLAHQLMALEALKDRQKERSKEFRNEAKAIKANIRRLATEIETGQETLFDEVEAAIKKKKAATKKKAAK